MRWPRAWTTASCPATAPSPAQHSASGEFFVFCCQWCCSPGTRTFKALKTRSSHFPLIQAEKIRTVESYLSSIKAHSCQWPWLKSIFELLNIEFRQIWNWIWSKLWKLLFSDLLTRTALTVAVRSRTWPRSSAASQTGTPRWLRCSMSTLSTVTAQRQDSSSSPPQQSRPLLLAASWLRPRFFLYPGPV